MKIRVATIDKKINSTRKKTYAEMNIHFSTLVVC